MPLSYCRLAEIPEVIDDGLGNARANTFGLEELLVGRLLDTSE
jgi:hypothetical protein